MGRKKISIEPIKDDRNRHVTFNKRKTGLIKKAMELSILCNCNISLVIFNAENNLFEYCSTDPRLILQRYCQVAHLPHERLTNQDYEKVGKKSKTKKDDDDESGDEMDGKESMNALSQQMQPQQDYQQLVDAANAANNSQPIQGSSTDTNAMQNLQQLLGQQNVEFTPRTSMVLAATIFGNQQLNTPAINSLLGGSFNNVDLANQATNTTSATNFESKIDESDTNGLKRTAQEAFDQNATEGTEINEGQQTAKKRKPNLTIQPPNGPQIPMKRVDEISLHQMEPPQLPLQTTQQAPTIQTADLNMPNASGFTPMSSGGISAFINNNPLPTPSGVGFDSYYDTLKGSTDNKQELKKET